MLHLTSSGRYDGKIKTGERQPSLTCDCRKRLTPFPPKRSRSALRLGPWQVLRRSLRAKCFSDVHAAGKTIPFSSAACKRRNSARLFDTLRREGIASHLRQYSLGHANFPLSVPCRAAPPLFQQCLIGEPPHALLQEQPCQQSAHRPQGQQDPRAQQQDPCELPGHQQNQRQDQKHGALL